MNVLAGLAAFGASSNAAAHGVLHALAFGVAVYMRATQTYAPEVVFLLANVSGALLAREYHATQRGSVSGL